jgi:hypothetical protein
MKIISINRAPVLTLWPAVVGQRLGFDEDEALTLGKAGRQRGRMYFLSGGKGDACIFYRTANGLGN